jgi:glycosyltransferase involved in cell wall biosynthesis
MKLLIHHHALVYHDKYGYWFPSFIGSWLNEISNQFEEVAFIGEVTANRIERQDFLVNKTNFKVLSYGTRGLDTSSQKKQRIIELGKQYSSHFSQLIIRGITPRQYLIYKSFKNVPTAFLMVGSLSDSKPRFTFGYIAIVVWLFYYRRRFQLRLISKSAKVFANSPQVINELKHEMKIHADFVPTNTLQNSQFKYFEFRGFRTEPVLLFCGRVVKEKGIEELILAVKELKLSGLKIKLLIVGSVTKSYKAYLDKILLNEGIKDEVVFEGFKKFGDELLSFYKMADMYILPSYHEGFPHSIWEACSQSTPVLTTRVGGIIGLVSENEVFFTKVKSVLSLKNSIEFVLDNPMRAKQKALKAFELAQSYTIENCVYILKEKLLNTQ